MKIPIVIIEPETATKNLDLAVIEHLINEILDPRHQAEVRSSQRLMRSYELLSFG